jgi:hypothetical protein
MSESGTKPIQLKKKSLPAKICRVCGDMIELTRRSVRDWETIQYCSAACRRTGVWHGRLAEAS